MYCITRFPLSFIPCSRFVIQYINYQSEDTSFFFTLRGIDYALCKKENMTCKTKTLTVGVLNNLHPFTQKCGKSHNGFCGMDIDIIEMAAKRGGYQTVEFKGYEYFEGLWSSLLSGKLDVAAGNLWVTENQKTENNVLYTLPYYVAGGAAAGYKKETFGGCPPINVESLTGKRIGIIKGELSFYRMYIPPQYLKEGTRFYNDQDALVKEGVEQGQVDVSLTQFFTNREGNVQFSLLIPMHSAFATLQRETLDALNKGLFEMWVDGSLYKIKQDYLRKAGIPVQKELPCEVEQYAVKNVYHDKCKRCDP